MAKESDGCPAGGHTHEGSCENSMGQSGYGGSSRRLNNEEDDYKCFPASALVHTPRGLVAMSEIRVGDTVFSRVPRGGRAARRVTRVLTHEPALVWKARFESGQALRVTPGHTFLALKHGWYCWRQLRAFCPGDAFVTADGPTDIVRSLAADGVEPVFNLHTEGEHNFVVDGFVAHNFTHLRAARERLHRWFIDPPMQARPIVA